MTSIRTLNLVAAIVHLLVLIVIITLFVSLYHPSYNINTSTYMLTSKTVENSPEEIISLKVVQNMEYILPGLIITFVFITVVFHFIYFGLDKIYKQMMNNENNYIRWLEYALSASVMLIVIGISVGEKSFKIMVCTLFINIVVMFLGDLIEKNIKKSDRSTAIKLTTVAWILYSLIWISLTASFAETVKNNDSSPSFVPAVFVTMFVLFSSFGVVQLYQLIHPNTPYVRIEITYIILSLVSKVLLSLLVSIGIVAR